MSDPMGPHTLYSVVYTATVVIINRKIPEFGLAAPFILWGSLRH